jgi:hypothetical protein
MKAEFSAPDINQLTTGVSSAAMINDHIQVGTVEDNSHLGRLDNTEMADVDGEGEPGQVKR